MSTTRGRPPSRAIFGPHAYFDLHVKPGQQHGVCLVSWRLNRPAAWQPPRSAPTPTVPPRGAGSDLRSVRICSHPTSSRAPVPTATPPCAHPQLHGSNVASFHSQPCARIHCSILSARPVRGVTRPRPTHSAAPAPTAVQPGARPERELTRPHSPRAPVRLGPS